MLQKHLARELRADPAATSCAQMSRLPGFFNQSHYLAPLVAVEYRNTNRTYTPSDFPDVEYVMAQPRAGRYATPSSDRAERARHYLAAVPPAIQGPHGDSHTFRMCCRFVRGFALTNADAMRLLTEWTNGVSHRGRTASCATSLNTPDGTAVSQSADCWRRSRDRTPESHASDQFAGVPRQPRALVDAHAPHGPCACPPSRRRRRVLRQFARVHIDPRERSRRRRPQAPRRPARRSLALLRPSSEDRSSQDATRECTLDAYNRLEAAL
jgi:hypothetical protein